MIYNRSMKIPNKFQSGESREAYYERAVLPLFEIEGDVAWQEIIATGPDDTVALFVHQGVRYGLVFDDYPGGFSDFAGKPFARAMRATDGGSIVSVSAEEGYIADVTGYFMLFIATDTKLFANHIEEKVLEYERWQSGSELDDCEDLVTVSRDLLKLIEVAALNKDAAGLYAVGNIIDGFIHVGANDNSVSFELLRQYVTVLEDTVDDYEIHSEKELGEIKEQVYRELSYESQRQLAKNEHTVQFLGETATLVSAMYVKREYDMTAGISIVFLVDGDTVTYPNDHFMNDELKRYFKDNRYINDVNIQHHIPDQLGDYSLVQGSESVRRIFRRELDYLNW